MENFRVIDAKTGEKLESPTIEALGIVSYVGYEPQKFSFNSLMDGEQITVKLIPDKDLISGDLKIQLALEIGVKTLDEIESPIIFVLVGLPYTGKETWAQRLNEYLGIPVIDIDSLKEVYNKSYNDDILLKQLAVEFAKKNKIVVIKGNTHQIKTRETLRKILMPKYKVIFKVFKGDKYQAIQKAMEAKAKSHELEAIDEIAKIFDPFEEEEENNI